MDAQVSGRTAKPMDCGACAFTCCFCALRRLRLGTWNFFMALSKYPATVNRLLVEAAGQLSPSHSNATACEGMP